MEKKSADPPSLHVLAVRLRRPASPVRSGRVFAAPSRSASRSPHFTARGLRFATPLRPCGLVAGCAQVRRFARGGLHALSARTVRGSIRGFQRTSPSTPVMVAASPHPIVPAWPSRLCFASSLVLLAPRYAARKIGGLHPGGVHGPHARGHRRALASLPPALPCAPAVLRLGPVRLLAALASLSPPVCILLAAPSCAAPFRKKPGRKIAPPSKHPWLSGGCFVTPLPTHPTLPQLPPNYLYMFCLTPPQVVLYVPDDTGLQPVSQPTRASASLHQPVKKEPHQCPK